MSATKARRKWAKTATADDLDATAGALERLADNTANVLIRCSLREQVKICRDELQRRAKLAGGAK